MSPAIPGHIGKYRVQSEIGRGGYGRVYRALDPAMGRVVAIKVLTERDEGLLTRFHNEASLAANLLHDNIVTIYEYGNYQDRPYLAMELLEGSDLHHIISSGQSLDLLEKYKIMLQVAEGLRFAHNHGVIHRDIKPANIRVLPGGRAKIMDFGIARATQEGVDSRLTQEGFLVGTMSYMAPELLAGEDATTQTDIFAFGVTFYELLTGHLPFQAPTPAALIAKISSGEPAAVADFVPNCPDTLQIIIQKLLNKDPDLRYQELGEVQFDIEALMIERQQEISGRLLQEAESALQGTQLERAHELIQHVRRQDPHNRRARQLWGDVESKLRAKALQPKIDSLTHEAQDYIFGRRFSEAVQALTKAVGLDPENRALKSKLNDALALQSGEKKALDLTRQARTQLRNSDLSAANDSVSLALQADSACPDAKSLQVEIDQRLGQARREELARELVIRSKDLIRSGAFDQAKAELEQFGEAHGFPGIERALESVEEERARHNARKRLETLKLSAKGLQGQKQFEDATKIVQKLLTEFPEDTGVQKLQQELASEHENHLRNIAIGQAVSDATARLEAGEVQSAQQILERALSLYPNAGSLVRCMGAVMSAKAALDRANALTRTLGECRQLQSKGLFLEALKRAEGARQAFGDDVRLNDITRELQDALKAAQRGSEIQSARREAEVFLSEGNFQAAIELLDRTAVRLNARVELTEFREAAENRRREAERSKAVTTTRTEVERYLAAREFSSALDQVSAVLKRWPQDPVLVALRSEVVAQKNTADRQRRIEEYVDQIEAEISKKQFSTAQAICFRACDAFPDVTEIRALKLRLEGEIAERNRLSRIEETIANARDLLAQDRAEQAAAQLGPVLAENPEESELAELLANAQERIEAQRCRLAVESLAKEAKSLAERQRFTEAIEVLEHGLSDYPAERILVETLGAIRTARSARLREQAISERAKAIRNAIEVDRFDEASKLAESARGEFSGAVEIESLVAQIRAKVEARLEFSRLLQDGRKQLEAGAVQPALTALTAARKRLPEEPERLREIEDLLLRHAHRLAPGDWRSAELLIKELEAAETSFHAPKELRQQIAGARESEAIAASLATAKKMEDAGDVRAALAEIEKTLGRYAGCSPLMEFQAKLSAEIRQAKQELLSELDALQSKIPTVYTKRELRQLQDAFALMPESKLADEEVERKRALIAQELSRRSRAIALAKLPVRKIAISMLAVAGAGAVAWFVLTRPAPLKVVSAAVSSVPAGAAITAAGDACSPAPCTLHLKPGDYEVTARLAGFSPAQKRMRVTAQGANTLGFLLAPLPAALNVATNFATGKVVLDHDKPVALQNGEFRVSSQPFGRHTLKIDGEGGSSEFSFDIAPGNLPVIAGAITEKNVSTIAIATLGDKARIECNCAGAPVSVEGKAVGVVQSTGLDVAGWKPTEKIQVGDRQVSLGGGTGPAVNVFVASNSNNGTLELRIDPDNTVAMVDDHSHAIWGTRLQLVLPAGSHRVMVRKDGYEPSDQTVNLPKGSQLTTAIHLIPLPTTFKKSVTPSDSTAVAPAPVTAIAPSAAPPDEAEIAHKRRADEEAAWNGVDKNSVDKLRSFVESFPDGAHAGEAKKRVSDLEAEQQRMQAQREAEQKQQRDADARAAQQAAEAERQRQEEEKKRRDDEAASVAGVRSALELFRMAYQNKDLKGMVAIFPKLEQKKYGTEFGFMKQLQVQMLVQNVKVSGNGATASGTIATPFTATDGTHQPGASKGFTAILKRIGATWQVESIEYR